MNRVRQFEQALDMLSATEAGKEPPSTGELESFRTLSGILPIPRSKSSVIDIFVPEISESATEHALAVAYGRFGRVTRTRIISGKNIGFVRYTTQKAARDACGKSVTIAGKIVVAVPSRSDGEGMHRDQPRSGAKTARRAPSVDSDDADIDAEDDHDHEDGDEETPTAREGSTTPIAPARRHPNEVAQLPFPEPVGSCNQTTAVEDDDDDHGHSGLNSSEDLTFESWTRSLSVCPGTPATPQLSRLRLKRKREREAIDFQDPAVAVGGEKKRKAKRAARKHLPSPALGGLREDTSLAYADGVRVSAERGGENWHVRWSSDD
ncbi:hypothetical protein HKX48_000387 [Thoreauomyces humboldtii]|nr:hypothetical protein HKX48_000387 [Thoreauomyces humboldtii]